MNRFNLIIIACSLFNVNLMAQNRTANIDTKSILVKTVKTYQNGDVLDFLNHKKIKNINTTFGCDKIQSIGSKIHGTRSFVFYFQGDIDIHACINKYNDTKVFSIVEPNYIGHGGGVSSIPNDTYFANRQWGLYNDGTFSLYSSTEDADIDIELAWDIEEGDPNLIIAVLDSGVKLDHPELADHIWHNINENNDGTDTDTNGYIDDFDGWNFAYDNNNVTDDQGHGTNVCGLISAKKDNNLGYAGVNSVSNLMACKILNSENSGFYSWWIDAIYYAVDNGANCINMSVGGSGYSALMKDAVDYAHAQNVPIMVSMMNFDNQVTYYPAGYQSTIAVGATNPDDTRVSPFFWSNTSGSNYGDHIDLVAPGNYMYGLSNTSNTNFNSYWGGTSQAAPLVTGVVSLIQSRLPNATVEEIRTILRSTSEDQVGISSEDTPGWDKYFGAGRLNAHQALNATIVSNSNLTPSSTLNVFPNPAHIHTPLNITWQDINIHNIKITDMDGRLIFDQNIKGNSSNLTFQNQHFTPGVYLIICQLKDGPLLTQKIVIQ